MPEEGKPSAEEIRSLLALEPGLAQLADSLRRDFGARLVGLQAGGRDIGWTRYRASVRDAVDWGGPFIDIKKAREEWKEISRKAFETRTAARSSAAARKSRVVR